MQKETNQHKAGFVNIIGYPNVGKSTLMNRLVGEKISIITSKAQTTRHRIIGIVNGEDFQIVYSDTPGMLIPKYKLQESMLKFAMSALSDADILMYVTDIFKNPDEQESLNSKISSIDVPVLLVINKIDLSEQDKVNNLAKQWKTILPQAEVFLTSATEGFNIEGFFTRIIELLPESPAYFPKDQLTDKSMRFFVAEIIREKILLNYKKEIPYSVEIKVEEYKESPGIIKIRSIIFVARDSQKGIIIGHKGQSLKKTGTDARKDIEAFVGKKVYLELFVKVNKDWRNQPKALRYFGYEI